MIIEIATSNRNYSVVRGVGLEPTKAFARGS